MGCSARVIQRHQSRVAVQGSAWYRLQALRFEGSVGNWKRALSACWAQPGDCQQCGVKWTRFARLEPCLYDMFEKIMCR